MAKAMSSAPSTAAVRSDNDSALGLARAARIGILPFHQWHHRGIRVRRSHLEPDRTSSGSDSFGRSLVDTDGLDENSSSSGDRLEKQSSARAQRLAASPLAARVEAMDSFKLGEEDSAWIEPEGTSRSDFDPSIPPFARVLQAKRDFFNSRSEELLAKKRSRRLFDTMLYSLEIRSDATGPHWQGTGPHGEPYRAPSLIRKTEYFNPHEFDEVDLLSGNEVQPPGDVAEHSRESCVFLRKPETSIRGVLALARKEVEAGWDIEPALKFSKMIAAFVTFLVHYDVLSEPHFREPLSRALVIARRAPAAILSAYRFEGAICDLQGFNSLCWNAYTGGYGEGVRGGLDKQQTQASATPHPLDDGGWTVGKEPTVEVISPQEARTKLQVATAGSLPSDIKVLSYIPFARRRVTHIWAPCEAGQNIPLPYLKDHFGIVTAPAPWTSAERWRTGTTAYFAEETDQEVDSVGPLEREIATINEPDEIILWCPGLSVDLDVQSREQFIGMGLRGRWAELGSGATRWWVFSAKDFILPSFWQSSTGQ